MKSLRTYLEDVFATPMNTMGMGGMTAPEGDTAGSGDIPGVSMSLSSKIKKKKKFKRYKIV